LLLSQFSDRIIGPGTDPYYYLSVSSCLFCWSIARLKVSVVSNLIGIEFGTIVFQVNSHRLTEWIFDVTSYFQDGGYDVRPPLAAAR